MKERLERLKECALKWVEARAKFFDNVKNNVNKMALKNAERNLAAATREVQRIEEGHGDRPGAGNKSNRPPRWISMAEATPEMELGIERYSTSIPTEYRTEDVLVWDDTFEEVRTDYRIETAHGTLWKSRRPHRWWMPRNNGKRK